jgi:formylmethanofuran dehydrogenase subunit E
VASQRNESAKNEIRCDSCGELFYVDDLTFESINRAIREGLDNPFICPNCEQAYEELSHN